MDKNTIDELAGKLADAIPGELADDLKGLRGDVESNFKALLTAGLDKLELVTREEFDVQRKVLERTRQKLDQLEQELRALQDASDTPTQ